MLGDSSHGRLQIRPLSGRLSHLHPDLIGPPLGRDQCRDDPLANDVAEMWKKNENQAIKNAAEWTKRYAVERPGS